MNNNTLLNFNDFSFDFHKFYNEIIWINKIVPLDKINNFVISEMQRVYNLSNFKENDCYVSPEQIINLLTLEYLNIISFNTTKSIFKEMLNTGLDCEYYIAKNNLVQSNDNEYTTTIIKNILGFFIGKITKSMEGKGNPKLINDLLIKELDNI